MTNAVVDLLRAFLRAYQLLLSPWVGPACRFAPSCSEYAREALLLHGPLRGTLLSARRLGKCHPWHAGGVDLVPPVESPRADADIVKARSHA
ncbi:MAG: membrane protein insertion efficiency factor YidD [Candidatus Binatia bacterium]|nr:membrane protein insertion efficiency factor YidD [Candidatus Binatia bacterium]